MTLILNICCTESAYIYLYIPIPKLCIHPQHSKHCHTARPAIRMSNTELAVWVAVWSGFDLFRCGQLSSVQNPC